MNSDRPTVVGTVAAGYQRPRPPAQGCWGGAGRRRRRSRSWRRQGGDQRRTAWPGTRRSAHRSSAEAQELGPAIRRSGAAFRRPEETPGVRAELRESPGQRSTGRSAVKAGGLRRRRRPERRTATEQEDRKR